MNVAFPLGAILAAIGASALAVQALCIRYGTVKSRSTHALIVVLLTNILLLVPITFLLTDPLAEYTTRSLIAFIAAGLVGTMAGRAFYYEGIKRIGASRSEPIKASQPLHASLLAVVVIGESVSGPHLVSMLCIVFGVALITWETSRNDGGPRAVSKTALLLPVVGAVFYGIEPVIASLGFAEGTTALPGLLVKTVAATIGFFAYLLYRNAVPPIRSFTGGELRWLLLAGIANTAFLIAYYRALEITAVSIVVPIVQSSPLVVILLSALFVGSDLEEISWKLGGYTLLVVAGAIGVTLFG